MKEEYKSSVVITDLLEKKLGEDKIKLENKEEMIIKRQLISLPKYLIIIINNKTHNKTFKSFLKKTINMKEFSEKDIKNTEYELVNIIDKDSIATCKSPIDSKFYTYNEEKKQIENNHKNICPHLIMYKLIN